MRSKRFFFRTCCVLAACNLLMSAFSSRSEETALGIPLKPDPPIAVDGDLGDWSAVPNAITVDKPEQVIYGAGTWQSSSDMSGTVRLAWRQECLFLAASVVDDQLVQTQRGADIWRGDHVELYVDARPELEPTRDALGEGQFHLGFSPGNFQHTGDSFTDCPPEAYCFRPEGVSLDRLLVASQQTANGWTLEAAIPWTLFGITPEQGLYLRIELALSDTDSPEPRQESMITTSTAKWVHTRSRMVPAALAGTDGVAPPQAGQVKIFDAVQLAQGAKQDFSFDAPAVPEGRRAILRVLARMDTPRVAGFTHALCLTLNGEPLSGRRLVNKPLRVKSRAGNLYSMYAGECMATFYSPDFTAPDIDPYYGLLGDIRPCLFEFDVTDVLKQGPNEIEVSNRAVPAVTNVLHAADGALSFRLPPPPEKEKAGPPSGPLPVCEPQSALKTEFAVKELPDSNLELTFSGQTFTLQSRFSSPKPEWVTGSCDFFTHERRIEARDEGVVVFDTFTNRTNENLGIMHRHEVTMGAALKRLWLAGLEQPGLTGKTSSPPNPTTFGCTENAGIGLVAFDDVTRVHAANYAADGALGLADNNLVLPPGKSHTAEWIIIPTATPDYWRFINAARRFMDSNFTIDGGFVFLRQGPLTDAWTDQQVLDFLTFKEPYYVCSSIGAEYKGMYSHGTSFQQIPHDAFKKSFARWRPLYPNAKYLVYFHCYIDVADGAAERFADARLLRPDGQQADYGEPYYRLFFPTETNSYGPAIAKNVDIILDDIKADGVYWDEHEYSRFQFHYGEPWDNVSGDIDPKTMKVTNLKSCVTLLTEPWRVKLANHILSRGPLVGNGVPHTRATAALKFPCFVETGSITNCALSHLYSPIALGDHLTERSELDAYENVLAALDYGCVYHWYNDMTVIPTHKTLTSHMYPITPIELHQGYIIGKERIITKVSGLFGWGDASPREVHAYDAEGKEAPDFNAPLIEQDGKTYTELRIAEGWSAAILRN